MKRIFQMIGLICFIIFSFFYTDRVMTVIREEDKIMIELKNIQSLVHVKASNAIIVDDTIIPGSNGKRVNIDKSYKAMRSKGIFEQSEIVFDKIQPDISILQNKDKYVVLGNPKKKSISILFILDDDKYLGKVQSILNDRDVVSNYFVSYDYLISNTTEIKEMKNCEVYSYGDNGNYTPDYLLFSNNLISRISNHEANICMALEKDKDILTLCNKNNLYTIIPDIIVLKNGYDIVKSSITSGSMILFYMNQDTVRDLGVILDYIHSKGYEFSLLSQLISEDIYS